MELLGEQEAVSFLIIDTGFIDQADATVSALICD